MKRAMRGRRARTRGGRAGGRGANAPATLVADGHLDLAWNALQWNRDIALDIAVLRSRPGTEVQVVSSQPMPGGIVPTVTLGEMRRGGVGLCFATLLARSTGTPIPHLDYPSPEQAHAAARGQLAYYRALEAKGLVRVIADRRDLEAHVRRWAGPDPSSAPPLGLIIAGEGADFVLEPGALAGWHAAGLRALSLTHFGTGRYAGGTDSDQGLFPSGSALLREMRRLGMILDVSHLSERSFCEVLGLWDGPVMASHNNCRALVPGQRQLSDTQIRLLTGRGAVIGAVFDAWMLVPGWERGGSANPRVTLEAVADHIDHVCQLAGDSRHAAIGSDLDGGFGKEQSPGDLDTIADVQKLAGLLRRRGHSDADVAAIFHGNWTGLLRRAWTRKVPG